MPAAEALPNRIFIQFGQKWYGVHLGATNIPDEEDDPRLSAEPNLYYTQQDILAAFCSKHNIGWNASFPSFVIGAALDSSQSLLFPILVYASVQKYRGKKLEFPGDLAAWYAPQSLSNAVLNSYQYEWMALTNSTTNQAFNTYDACEFTWGKMWPRLAKWFGMESTGPQIEDDGRWRERSMKMQAPQGYGGKTTFRYRFSFAEWARDQENVAAWKELAERHGLRESEWRDVGSVFGRADFCLQRNFASVMRSVTITCTRLFLRLTLGQHDERKATWLVWIRGQLRVDLIRCRGVRADEDHTNASKYIIQRLEDAYCKAVLLSPSQSVSPESTLKVVPSKPPQTYKRRPSSTV